MEMPDFLNLLTITTAYLHIDGTHYPVSPINIVLKGVYNNKIKQNVFEIKAPLIDFGSKPPLSCL